MQSILYAIGFTAGFLLCAFIGWSSNSIPLDNLLLMFSGFCAGGMALCILENRNE
jgi:hypothetical protein